MPILPEPSYRASRWQFNGHMQTIWPSIFRRVNFHYKRRERLELPDGDFVDLDWKFASAARKKLLVITHGLEGDSGRHYVKGMAKLFSENGYDVLGWNCRSCSGELNRLLRFYHHGDAGDLRLVIDHALQQHGYEELILAGFSMGGSLTLRLAGEDPDNLPRQVKKLIGFSVPCSLLSSVEALALPENSIYQRRFLRKLGKKIRGKEKSFPGLISAANYADIRHFVEFDNRYTAPLHGFKDAFDFYEKASVKPLLGQIRIPALIVQAQNDPFLGKECYPFNEAMNNANLFLEIPRHGGHCGFMLPGSEYTWAELRALQFARGQ
ncbi:MAG: alpha/beta fold hydrolase [Chitinophagaceae bacterium]|nr:alpha/beta fold hydrolase [Chitinophagaceae bacterium]